MFLDYYVPCAKWPHSSDLYNVHLDNRPKLNRIFFIGDGLTETGTGDLQKFIVPKEVPSLFLGFADAGPHGWFDDKKGSLKVTYDINQESEEILSIQLDDFGSGMYMNNLILGNDTKLNEKFIVQD